MWTRWTTTSSRRSPTGASRRRSHGRTCGSSGSRCAACDCSPRSTVVDRSNGTGTCPRAPGSPARSGSRTRVRASWWVSLVVCVGCRTRERCSRAPRSPDPRSSCWCGHARSIHQLAEAARWGRPARTPARTPVPPHIGPARRDGARGRRARSRMRGTPAHRPRRHPRRGGPRARRTRHTIAGAAARRCPRRDLPRVPDPARPTVGRWGTTARHPHRGGGRPPIVGRNRGVRSHGSGE